MPPSESDIRAALVRIRDFGDADQSIWLSELSIAGGTVRADLVRLNGMIEAFEIKSRRDSLDRLVNQAWYYGKAFDAVHLVADRKHIDGAESILPHWWGLWEVSSGHPVSIRLLRNASENPVQDGSCLASLLTRPELLMVLRGVSRDFDVRTMPLHELWDVAVRLLSPRELHTSVLSTLSGRNDQVGQFIDASLCASRQAS